MTPKNFVSPLNFEEQSEATSVRLGFRSERVRMSTVTSQRARPRLGRSLRPLGKPLVADWKCEPGTSEGLSGRVRTVQTMWGNPGEKPTHSPKMPSSYGVEDGLMRVSTTMPRLRR